MSKSAPTTHAHFLANDSGWPEVAQTAQTALDFVERFARVTAGDQARG